MISRFNSKDKTYLQFANDLTEAQTFLETTPVRWPSRSSVTNAASKSWDLDVGYDGAMRLAKTGWSQGALDLHFAVQAMPVAGRASSIRYDVAGDFADVGRFCAGDPLHMRSRRSQKPHTPVIHMIVNVVTGAATSAQAFKHYGAALVALIDQIENRGRRVELDVVTVNGTTGTRLVSGWKVKQAADAIDLSAVAFSIAHPAAYRRLMFGFWERSNPDMYRPGYGSCQRLKKSDAALLGNEDAFLLDGVGVNTRTDMSQLDALRLAAQQINLAADETLLTLEN